jgi:hypothetical protein
MADYLDEFAALDAALEQISEQYEAPKRDVESDAAFDDMLYDEAPPPPVPDFDESPFEGPDVLQYSNPVIHAAGVARGEQFATARSLNIDAELAEYSAGQTMRNSAQATTRNSGSQATTHNSGQNAQQGTLKQSGKVAAAPAPAPWGEETLRFSSSGAAQSRPATAATMRVATESAAVPRGFLIPLHEEFDLNNPPEEEKQKFVLPVLDPQSKEVSLSISCMDGRCEEVRASLTWTVQQLLHTMGSKLSLWQVSFFALSETDVNANAPDRWLDPRNTLQQENVVNGTRLVFKIKFFKYPRKLRDPTAVHYFYAQVLCFCFCCCCSL